jgi:DNA-binding GntR family transcriptional regulator
MYACYLRKEADGYYRANQTIHTKIVEASRNAPLSKAYASFTGRMRRIRYSTNQARRQERWAEAVREHEAILDALHRRAGSEVSEMLFMHLRQKQAAAIAYWKESKVLGT